MSLNSEKDSTSVPKLTRENFSTWLEMIKDYINALEHEDAPDIWLAFEWRPNPNHDPNALGADGNPLGPQQDPADHNYQDVSGRNSGPAKKLRVQHNKAFKFIRQRLSEEFFEETQGMPTHVPKLLRKLRSYWNDGSTHDVNAIRKEFESLRLEDTGLDMKAFQTKFLNKLRQARNFNVGTAATDEDALYRFNEALPAAWKTTKSAAAASGLKFKDALRFYLQTAKDDETLPGTLKLSASVSIDRAHTVTDAQGSQQPPARRETCRDFAKGKCRRGSKCAYEHPSHIGERGRPSCTYCGKPGHTEEKCWAKKRHAREAQQQQDTANVSKSCPSCCNCASADPDDDDNKITIDDAAFVTVGDVDIALAVAALEKVQPKTKDRLLLVLDGASTCAIVRNPALCYDLNSPHLAQS